MKYDEAKDAANFAKHGVSLAFGAIVLSVPLGEIEHDRRDYGEMRLTFGLVEGRLCACTYTIRGGVIRIISA